MIPATVARNVTSLGEVLIHIKTIVILCGHEPSGFWCKAWARSAVGDGGWFGIPSSHVFVQQFLDACHKPQTQPHVATPGKQKGMDNWRIMNACSLKRDNRWNCCLYLNYKTNLNVNHHITSFCVHFVLAHIGAKPHIPVSKNPSCKTKPNPS